MKSNVRLIKKNSFNLSAASSFIFSSAVKIFALIAIISVMNCAKNEKSNSSGSKNSEPKSFPYGLFSLDNKWGTYRDSGIRDLNFIRGYVWRYSWADFEKTKDQYDFAPIKHIISKLSAINQKLSIIIIPDTPSYLSSEPNIETWNDNGVTKPIAWDSDLRSRFEAFIKALSEYKVPDPSANGAEVELKRHSVLEIIHPSFPGLPRGAIRDDVTKVSEVPGYTRTNLVINTIEADLKIVKKYFPDKLLIISLWRINDSLSSPPLWREAQLKVLEFEKTFFWQDNLAASRPCEGCEPVTGFPNTLYSEPLLPINHGKHTGFQMLSSWLKPINPDHVDNVSNGTPMDGIKYAFDTYQSSYFELYPDDIDNAAWQADLKKWAEALNGL